MRNLRRFRMIPGLNVIPLRARYTIGSGQETNHRGEVRRVHRPRARVAGLHVRGLWDRPQPRQGIGTTWLQIVFLILGSVGGFGALIRQITRDSHDDGA